MPQTFKEEKSQQSANDERIFLAGFNKKFIISGKQSLIFFLGLGKIYVPSTTYVLPHCPLTGK
jgi:hypothetical protein